MTLKTTLWRTVAVGLTLGAGALGLALDPMTLPRSSAEPPSAEPPGLLPDFPRFPGYYESSIGEGLLVNGQRVNMRHFFTEEPAYEVAEFYESEFDARGYDPLSYEMSGARHISVPTEDGQFMQVMILEVPEGGAMVVPSLASGPVLPGKETVGLPLPLPEKVEGLTSFRSEDGGSKAVSAQFTTPQDMESLSRFYQERLGASGWSQAPGALRTEDESGLMRFEQADGTRASIGIQGLAAGAGSFVFILYEEPIQ